MTAALAEATLCALLLARLTRGCCPLGHCSRWEKHCGSKAKKWRISLRVVPGERQPQCLSSWPLARMQGLLPVGPCSCWRWGTGAQG